jgi:osomolarity two-component system sensor histidine kinase TcsA
MTTPQSLKPIRLSNDSPAPRVSIEEITNVKRPQNSRKHSEQHLQPLSPLEDRAAPASDSDLAAIFALIPTPTLVLDAKLRVIQVSDSHLNFAGFDREECLGQSIFDFPPHKVPAPDISTLHRAITTAITSTSPQVIDGVEVAVGADISIYQLRITPVLEGGKLRNVLVAAHDVTSEHPIRQSKKELVYMNETYRILVDTVKEYAIFMLDTSGHVATWNSAAAILKGYSSDEIIGRHYSIFYGDDARAAEKPTKQLEVCLREGKVEDEGWRFRKDGSRFWANVLMTPVYTAGLHIGFAKVTRDLTDRKAAEERLIAAYEESSKLKSDFLANMSHEIRTPMHGMLMAIQMLSETSVDEKQQEYVSIIEDTGSLLLQIINDVLDYSKLSSGTFSVSSGVVDIKEVVTAVYRNCHPALKPGVDFRIQFPDKLPKHVKGDPLRYRQIIQNLVGNAAKFTDHGSIQIDVTCQQQPEDETAYEVTTKVTDTGIGIPEDGVSSLFTPFSRFADTNQKKYQGTGLGLSICKSLAEVMDGQIGFHLNPSETGSVFWLSVKMGNIDATRSETHTLELRPKPDLNETIKKIAPHKQILLVEDNMVNQTIMLKMLKIIGFEKVDTAWNGAEAVRKVKQKPLSFSTILMDVNMPVMDGMDATVAIRKMNRDIPIIAMTGNALKGDAETYLAKGMNDYIAKPVHRQHLVSVLLKWIGS